MRLRAWTFGILFIAAALAPPLGAGAVETVASMPDCSSADATAVPGCSGTTAELELGTQALATGSDTELAALLRGRQGRDVVYVGEGDDNLRGGPGRDVCFGGDGADAFRFCAMEAADGLIYGNGPLRTLRVEVDPLLDESLPLFTAYVDWILSDPRSWIGGNEVTWHRVGAEDSADVTIVLAAPQTVDDICFPLNTGGSLSCRNGDTVALNVDRWNNATSWWPASLHVYRTYLINHEVGHFLGYGHTSCSGAGQAADVMQQQTKTLDGCVANGWPYPDQGGS